MDVAIRESFAITAAAAAVFRNNLGELLGCDFLKISATSPLEGEAVAAIRGVEMTTKLGFEIVVREGDSAFRRL